MNNDTIEIKFQLYAHCGFVESVTLPASTTISDVMATIENFIVSDFPSLSGQRLYFYDKYDVNIRPSTVVATSYDRQLLTVRIELEHAHWAFEQFQKNKQKAYEAKCHEAKLEIEKKLQQDIEDVTKDIKFRIQALRLEKQTKHLELRKKAREAKNKITALYTAKIEERRKLVKEKERRMKACVATLLDSNYIVSGTGESS